MTFSQAIGLFRSLVIYYQPNRRSAWQRFYKNLIKPGQLAFDVGAHVGSRSRVLSSLGAKVVAIEPQRHLADFLARSLPKEIVLIRAALGPRFEQRVLRASSKHPTVSSLKADFVEQAGDTRGFENVKWDVSEVVEVLTLDSLIERHGQPHYLKIDVEGFELEVLQGLSTPVPLVSFEYLPGFKKLSHEVVARLMDLGDYSFNVVIGEKAAFGWDGWKDQEHLRKWLDELDPRTKSGDIFARLNAPNKPWSVKQFKKAVV